MKLSYILPAPAADRAMDEFDGDLACMKDAGYDAVELQIEDPSIFDEDRVRRSLQRASYTMCAFQTGATYYSRGNCLCTADAIVRRRTIELLKSFVALASRWNAVIVFGSLQGRLKDEPDRQTGAARIRDAIREVGEYAVEKQAMIAFEPVNHLEIGFHNTIAEVAALVRTLDLSSVRMMIDTFHMNIEEQDMLTPLSTLQDILAHVHLSETNRDVLGQGHWPTAAFFEALARIGYQGYCSVGVYHTRRSRHDCIKQCMAKLRQRGQSRT
ncbi:MAG: sugar phosphate isomerase/epimerase [Verrucomicrobia bacterium]|nr:sugar phosphate isomerase/epimerase [Verrucomicrobiota bacterium]